MAEPPPRTLKQVTQDDPKSEALNRKDSVLLQPTKPAPASAANKASFMAFLAESGFEQGTRFSFVTEYIGAPLVNPDVANGEGMVVVLTDSILKLSLGGKVEFDSVVRNGAKALGYDVDDVEFLKQQIGVYPGPKDSEDRRAIRFSQSFEIVTRTQIRLVTENELPPSQIPHGQPDQSSILVDFVLSNKGKPTLDLPSLWDDLRDDEGVRWFMRVWVEEPGFIKQVIGNRDVSIDKKTRRVIPDVDDESLEVRTEIRKL